MYSQCPVGHILTASSERILHLLARSGAGICDAMATLFMVLARCLRESLRLDSGGEERKGREMPSLHRQWLSRTHEMSKVKMGWPHHAHLHCQFGVTIRTATTFRAVGRYPCCYGISVLTLPSRVTLTKAFTLLQLLSSQFECSTFARVTSKPTLLPQKPHNSSRW